MMIIGKSHWPQYLRFTASDYNLRALWSQVNQMIVGADNSTLDSENHGEV
jgi:hypothetical protein